MKKIALLFMASAISSLSFAQEIKESEVPEAVKTTMKKKYSSVKVTTWEKEDGYYEAGFTVDKIKNSVLLDEKGTIKESEKEIPLSDLPKGVAEYVKKHHPNEKGRRAANPSLSAQAHTHWAPFCSERARPPPLPRSQN